MCSECSGDPEEPPEELPKQMIWEDDPFWAWWKQSEEDCDVEEGRQRGDGGGA